jgi:hypothetical protein
MQGYAQRSLHQGAMPALYAPVNAKKARANCQIPNKINKNAILDMYFSMRGTIVEA